MQISVYVFVLCMCTDVYLVLFTCYFYGSFFKGIWIVICHFVPMFLPSFKHH